MNEVIKPIGDFFNQNKIELFSILPFEKMRIINQNKFERCIIQNPKSVIIIALPYFTGYSKEANISLYARPWDYHLFFSHFFNKAKEYFESALPGYNFEGYADNSFIDERYAAVIGGLGVFGENGTVITKKYGSYVFLGEIITDMEAGLFYKNGVSPLPVTVQSCLHCGKCSKECPVKKGDCRECLSMITQKKGELTDDEISAMLQYNTIWGCDVCQTACPMNKSIEKTPIDFFYQNKICKLDSDIVNSMDDEEFKKRAFAWRGRKTILRNTEIYKKHHKEQEI